MKHMMQTQRGLSTVVATALMLSAVAVLGTTLVLWSNSNLRGYETSLAILSSDNTNRINEFLVIQNIWFCKNTCHNSGINKPGVNITIANYGNIGLNVTQIKLNDSRYVYTYTNVAILPGKEYFLNNKTNYPWHSGSAQNITITTGRGSIFTTTVTANRTGQ
jgi:hypothetical protein